MKPYRLIYVSIANDMFREAELIEILEVSRARNEREGISGMLL